MEIPPARSAFPRGCTEIPAAVRRIPAGCTVFPRESPQGPRHRDAASRLAARQSREASAELKFRLRYLGIVIGNSGKASTISIVRPDHLAADSEISLGRRFIPAT